MAATVLDGNKIASEIRAEVAAEVKALASSGMRPGWRLVLVGKQSCVRDLRSRQGQEQ